MSSAAAESEKSVQERINPYTRQPEKYGYFAHFYMFGAATTKLCNWKLSWHKPLLSWCAVEDVW